MKDQSFEKFYLTRVALGDCCGCAERVIDWRDIERGVADNRRVEGRRMAERKPGLLARFAALWKRR